MKTMLKLLLTLAIFTLVAVGASAQQVVNLCTSSPGNPFTSCIPVASTAPLPISVYDTGNHSGFCYTSNGSAAAATFQACGSSGGGALEIGSTSIGGGTDTFVLYDNAGFLGNEPTVPLTGDVNIGSTATATVVGIQNVAVGSPSGTAGTPVILQQASTGIAVGASYSTFPTNGVAVQGQVAIGTTTVSGTENLTIQGTTGTLVFGNNSSGSTVIYSNGGDLDLNVPSSNKIRWSVNGTFGMIYDNKLNLGSSTVSDANTFNVNGNASFGSYYSTTAPFNGIIVSGAVGIGTATVANQLDVNGAASVGYADVTAPANGLSISGAVTIGTPTQLGSMPLTITSTTGTLGIGTNSSSTTNLYSNSGDLDANVPTGDSFRWSVNSTFGMIYDGKLNLGSASKSDANTLNISGNASFGTFYSSAAPSGGLIASGSVGLGTATVANQLDVNGAASIGYVDVIAPVAGLIVSGPVAIGTPTQANSAIVSVTSSTGTITLGTSAASATGFYSGSADLDATVPSGNKFRWAENGANNMILSSSGLAIGSSSNVNNGTLSVRGSGQFGATYYDAGNTAPTNGLLVQGNTYIGTTSAFAGALLSVNGGIAQTTAVSCAAGVVTNSAGLFSACVASDERLKKDIHALSYDPSILMKMRPVSYRWKDLAARDDKIHIGFIAQDVEKLIPAAVVSAGPSLKTIDLYAAPALLTLVAQDHEARLGKVEDQIKVVSGAFPFHRCTSWYYKVQAFFTREEQLCAD